MEESPFHVLLKAAQGGGQKIFVAYTISCRNDATRENIKCDWQAEEKSMQKSFELAGVAFVTQANTS